MTYMEEISGTALSDVLARGKGRERGANRDSPAASLEATALSDELETAEDADEASILQISRDASDDADAVQGEVFDTETILEGLIEDPDAASETFAVLDRPRYVPRPEVIRDPRPGACGGADGVVARPGVVFDGVNPKVVALIRHEKPRVAKAHARCLKRTARMEAALDKTPDVIWTPVPGGGSKPWTLSGCAGVAGYWLAWGLVVAVGATFLLAFLAALDPRLAYSGMGAANVVAALSIAGLSWASSAMAKKFSRPVQDGMVKVGYAIGVPLMLAGLVTLFGGHEDVSSTSAAAWRAGADAAGSGASVAERAWLGARLFGELLIVSILKISIDHAYDDHLERKREANPRHKDLSRRLKAAKKLLRLHGVAQTRLEALAVAYAARRARYVAAQLNTIAG